ncbi:MFS transporter [Methylobrevis albus]|uniref:MFS transporter n=1 Tax=Methylobrevis albus TaxID=2793297 RepID=A0A931MYK4_9HYPH|nr:MFS transporter [Methylobrevis albus]MBH0238522.1 MFS transporter [Methylobrevis albus]
MPNATARPLNIPLVLFCGCLIAVMTFGPRATMGFFLTPMTTANGWSREVFALAIALQNLAWGIGQPIAGMLADRYGTWRVLATGTLLYGLGLVLMAYTTDPVLLQFTGGVLVGLGISGSAMFLVLAAFARLLPERLRPMSYGFGTAAGSLGQLLFAPIGISLLDSYGYQIALVILGFSICLVPLLAIPLKGKPEHAAVAGRRDQSIMEALREAFGHRSYRLLTAGFFVCGFHVAFVTTHLPPFVVDRGLDPVWGALAIGLIGGFNIIGSLMAGWLSSRWPKRWILSGIYFGRALVYGGFALAPTTPTTVLIFAAAAGFLWLSTVPPTQGLVVVMFGTRYVATLFGFVFLSHQIGAFFGVWLGGKAFDMTGSYDLIWGLGVLLALAAGIVHLPIVEKSVDRPLVAKDA